MKTQIDSSFQTLQNDLFSSGMVAKIGVSAFAVWSAIKNHADYSTGRCWPGMRRIAELTGLCDATVKRSIRTLTDNKLVRIETESGGSRSNCYIARERMDVRIGRQLVCVIVLDYVPAHMRAKVALIEDGVKKGEIGGEAFAECEIVPGPGFEWDTGTNTLKAAIAHSEIPPSPVQKQ